jgi:hypothetical protein
VSALVDAARVRDRATTTTNAGDPAGNRQQALDAAGQLARWLDARRAAALAGVHDIPVARSRRRALAAIANLATAPASTRATHAATAIRALSTATRPLGASLEHDLRALTAADAARPALALLASIASFAPTLDPRPAVSPPAAVVRVLIVLIPAG